MSEVKWHAELLADRERVRVLGRAVRAAVRPGDVVLDLGTGSGILAFIAARAGARRVYAIDEGHIIGAAVDAARRNRLCERIQFLGGSSLEVEVPERVDLIIAELIGAFGLGEHIVESVADARTRFLKPGGRLLPDRLEMIVAPTCRPESDESWYTQLLEDWDLDFAELRDMTRHLVGKVQADPASFLAPPQRLLAVDLHTALPGQSRGSVDFNVAVESRLVGFYGWFRASMGGQAVLTTAPPNVCPSWDHILLPVGEPVDLRVGWRLRLDARLDEPLWSWRVQIPDCALDRRLGDFHSRPASAFLPGGRDAPAERGGTEPGDSRTGVPAER